jgi:ankyrin repeat protein
MTTAQLIAAAKNGDIAEVDRCLKAGDDINTKINGDNALIWAAYAGRTEVVKLLIAQGADLNVTNSGGDTPFTLATRSNHADTAKILASAIQQSRPSVENWAAMGEATVAHIGLYPAIGKKITYIFNFASRERVMMAENLETHAETLSQPVCFDDLPRSVVETALAEFEKRDGKADRDFVLKGETPLGKPHAGTALKG